MRRLLPDPGPTSIEEQMELFEPAESAPAERPYLYMNFAATVDGRATVDGVSGKIGSDTDTAVLMALRESADAVLIGGGTMRVERYGRLLPGDERRERRRGAGRDPDPLAVIVSGSLDLPWDAGLFTCGDGEVVVFTTDSSEAPETATPVELVRFPREVDLAAALAHLRAERGVRALLSEGGPHLHGRLLSHGLVDELFLTIGAKLSGGGGPRIVEALGDSGPIELELRWLLAEGPELYARYATRS